MDPISNPFSPGAGSPPPELVGRDPILAQAATLLGRVAAGRSEKSLLLTGLRGVGKTVLLNEIERMALAAGHRTISIEASEEKRLAVLLVPYLRKVLFELDRVAGAGNKVRRGLAVLRSFIGSIKVTFDEVSVGLDIEPERGTADSGDLEIDLPDVFVAVGEAAHERSVVVVVLIDEIHYFNQKELGALIMAMHKVQQRQLPIVLLGAGLPILPGLAGESKSYAERLFSFPNIGPLAQADASKALQDPAQAAGIKFNDDALKEIFELTKGYPYFIQEWGYQAWNVAEASPISLEIIRSATTTVIQRLDANFFLVRYERLTPGEKNFLRAMAELGPGAHRTGDIAQILGVSVKSLGPVRAKLIQKGMVYSPAHGDMAFTVPLFDEFMVRTIPQFQRP